MARELVERYDVPRAVATGWVVDEQILPLLDGLDEVREAHRAACALLGLSGYHLSRNEIQDVLGEIANMTGGNIKSLLPHPSKLSIPAVRDGVSPAGELPGRPMLAQVAFECGGQPLIVTLLGRLPTHV